MKKIVLITNNSGRGGTLAHLMVQAGFDLRLVVVEDASLRPVREKWPMAILRKSLGPTYRWLKKMLLLSAEDRRALRYEQMSIEKANAVVEEYISKLGFKGRPQQIDHLEVPSLNSAKAITAVRKTAPDLCVVLGTSILKQTMIGIPRIGTINVHTSILPEYRGSRSEFWQCYNQDHKNVGITLHLIDKGVDTGGILFQKHQQVGTDADPNMLRANNTIAMLQNYVPVIEQLLNGKIEPKEQGQCTTPTYRFRDITLEKRLTLYKRLAADHD